MKQLISCSLIILFLGSCSNKKNNPVAPGIKPGTTDSSYFFPVTDYLLGQIVEIKSNHTNPLKITTSRGRIDSAWLKIEELEKEFAPFLTPQIDSVNMAGFFSETKFMDQTIDAITFTYEPKGPLPDSIAIQHWDVYVNPTDQKVKRIYLVKSTGPDKQQQLTWLSGNYCKIINLHTREDGSFEIESEQQIIWNF